MSLRNISLIYCENRYNTDYNRFISQRRTRAFDFFLAPMLMRGSAYFTFLMHSHAGAWERGHNRSARFFFSLPCSGVGARISLSSAFPRWSVGTRKLASKQERPVFFLAPMLRRGSVYFTFVCIPTRERGNEEARKQTGAHKKISCLSCISLCSFIHRINPVCKQTGPPGQTEAREQKTIRILARITHDIDYSH